MYALYIPSAHAAIQSKCQVCHNFTDKNKVGPALAGVFGRKNGQVADAKYSKDMKAHAGEWTWDEEHLRKWICNSKDAIKEFTNNPKASTRMPPQKVCEPARQAELIAFLKSISPQVEDAAAERVDADVDTASKEPAAANGVVKESK